MIRTVRKGGPGVVSPGRERGLRLRSETRSSAGRDQADVVHGKEVGTYYGDEGDVTALRVDLDQIPLARDLRAGRASPWLPLHRLA
jgi:hypothetical protein